MKIELSYTPEQLARLFHEIYEEEAVKFGWKTQEACRVPFEELPEANRRVMVEVARRILHRLREAPDA